MTRVIPLPAWEAVFRDFTRREGILFTLGDAGSGKSSFLSWLGERLVEARRRVALVDADIGQSHIGPPGTIGLATPEQEFGTLERLWPRRLEFVGNTSPVGHFLPCLVGAKRLAEEAEEMGIRHILINTTGLVRGEAAFALKSAKIRLLSPSTVVAFQREDELDPYLRWLRALKIRVHPLSVSPLARRRSVEERERFRKMRWRKWLGEGVSLTAPLSRIVRPGPPGKAWKNLMVGLLDPVNRVVSVGKVLERGKSTLGLLVAPAPVRRIAFILLGSGVVEE